MRNVSVQQTNAVHVPHERQERRPHKELTTACNIHLISNTPPRCEAIRHSATMRSEGFFFLLSGFFFLVVRVFFLLSGFFFVVKVFFFVVKVFFFVVKVFFLLSRCFFFVVKGFFLLSRVFFVVKCQCSTCAETPTQQSATTQDQHHAQGLALCHDVTLDIVTHRWVPAGHPQYTGARERRLWVAQAQTQLTLFVDPQSISLECEHGSGAEGSKQKVQAEGPRTQPERRTMPSSLVASQMQE